MTYQANHLKDIMRSVNDLLQVIQNIFKTYLVENDEEPLYDKKELHQLLKQLSLMSKTELRSQFENPIRRYAMPLPVRPRFAELYHAYTHHMLTLKRYTDIDRSNLILASEKIFFDTMFDALQKSSLIPSQITNDNLDDFFEELRINFQVSFLQRIKEPLKKATIISNIETLFEDPELVTVANTPFDDNEFTTPQLKYKLPQERLSVITPSLFQPAPDKKFSPINNRASSQSVTFSEGYDSDTGEEIIEISIF